MRPCLLKRTAVSLAVLLTAIGPLAAQSSPSPQSAASPLAEYLIPDQTAEIALARSAAPASISGDAEVLVLGRSGYTTAVTGRNGFVCLVERSWGAATDFPEFWNPRIRSPFCVNSLAAKTYLPTVLMKAKMVMEGKTKAEIAQAVKAGLDSKQLPLPAPGAMCYMMSKDQYLSDADKSWHPHMMWFMPGDAAKDWGANLPGSPIMAANDPEDRMTIFLVWAGQWSDGTPAPHQQH